MYSNIKFVRKIGAGEGTPKEHSTFLMVGDNSRVLFNYFKIRFVFIR